MNKDNNKAVAVKCEGCFTEWYSPNYREPYDDTPEYREYYDNEIIDEQPVIGPSLGDAETEFISNDLQCLCDRLSCDADDWEKAAEDLMATINTCLWDGMPRKWTYEGVHDVVITPYTKGNLPPVNEKSLEVYGDFKELVRARVAEI